MPKVFRFDVTEIPLNIGTITNTIGIRDAFLYNNRDTLEKNKAVRKPGLMYGRGPEVVPIVQPMYITHFFKMFQNLYG